VQKPDWIKLQAVGMDRSFLQAVVQAILDWNSQWRLGKLVYVSNLIDDLEPKADGSQTAAIAESGRIKINPRFKGDVRNLVLHEMTHVMKPNTPFMLRHPLRFSQGEIIGYHGLSLLVRLNTGEETRFQLFEEGVAEQAASVFRGYAVPNMHYFRIGVMTKRLFPNGALDFVKNNDVHGFVAGVMGIKPADVGAEAVEDAMKLYQTVYNG
jgi:hypothetical protein